MPIIGVTDSFEEVKKAVIDALDVEDKRMSTEVNNIIFSGHYQPGGPGMFQQSNLRNQSYAFNQHRRCLNSAVTLDEIIDGVKDLLKGKDEITLLRTRTGAVITGTERMEHTNYGCDDLLRTIIHELEQLKSQKGFVEESDNKYTLQFS